MNIFFQVKGTKGYGYILLKDVKVIFTNPLAVFFSIFVANIGFSSDATHTTAEKSKFASIPTEEMIFPLTTLNTIELNREADEFTGRMMFREQTLVDKLYSLMRGVF